MLKAVIMDFDGVIIDTELAWHQITTDWFKKNHNYDLPILEFLKCVGSTDKQLFDFLEQERGIFVDRDKFREDNHPLVLEKTKNIQAKDGVTDFIANIKNVGLKLALATSNNLSHAQGHLERLGLIDNFDYIVTKDHVANVKPYPDLFLLALEKLDVKQEEAIIIEDSVNGLKAGIAAGIRVINVPNEVTKYLDFTGCHALVKNILDIDLSKL